MIEYKYDQNLLIMKKKEVESSITFELWERI